MAKRRTRTSTREMRLARRGKTGGSAIQPLVSNLPPTEVLSPAGVEQIHRASMRLSPFSTR